LQNYGAINFVQFFWTTLYVLSAHTSHCFTEQTHNRNKII